MLSPGYALMGFVMLNWSEFNNNIQDDHIFSAPNLGTATAVEARPPHS